MEIEEDLLEFAREIEASCIASDMNEAELDPLRNLHFREKEGNLVPNRVARPFRVDSLALLFLLRGLAENSPSLKNPSAMS